MRPTATRFADRNPAGTPANPAKAAKTRASASSAADSDPCESLRKFANLAHGRAATAPDSQKFADIRKVQNRPETRASACDSQDSQLSQGYHPENEARPFRLAPADAAVAHADAWTDAQIELFKARLRRLLALGFSPQDAEDLAERLHLRDLHADHRHLCLECLHLAGSTATGWRCRNARAARVARDLPAELVTMAQDCPGFSTATRSTTT